MTIDDAYVELTKYTTLDRAAWADLLTLPEATMRDTIAGYRHLDWTRPGTSAGDAVLAALDVLASVLGAASGAATLAQVLRG